jgi:hypothetical protein
MAGEDTHKSQAQLGGNMPGPDVMLGVWGFVARIGELVTGTG